VRPLQIEISQSLASSLPASLSILVCVADVIFYVDHQFFGKLFTAMHAMTSAVSSTDRSFGYNSKSASGLLTTKGLLHRQLIQLDISHHQDYYIAPLFLQLQGVLGVQSKHTHSAFFAGTQLFHMHFCYQWACCLKPLAALFKLLHEQLVTLHVRK